MIISFSMYLRYLKGCSDCLGGFNLSRCFLNWGVQVLKLKWRPKFMTGVGLAVLIFFTGVMNEGCCIWEFGYICFLFFPDILLAPSRRGSKTENIVKNGVWLLANGLC